MTNEELETGKEELQSANEERVRAHGVVNLRNAELTQIAHDYASLVSAAKHRGHLVRAGAALAAQHRKLPRPALHPAFVARERRLLE